MLDSLPATLLLLIPLLGLLIGLVVVGSIFVVQPLVSAITRLGEAQGGSTDEASARAVFKRELRMASLERTLYRVLDEQEFQRDVQAGITAPAVKHPVRGDQPSNSVRNRLEYS